MASFIDVLQDRLPKPVQSALRPLYRMWQRSFIGRWIGLRLLHRSLRSNCLYDARCYWNHSSLRQYSRTQAGLQARIFILSHCIEKGLSHPSPRLRFGQQHLDNLLVDLTEYIAGFGHDLTTAVGLDVLAAYCRLHEQQGIRLEALESALLKMRAARQDGLCSGEAGGSVPVTRAEIYATGKMDIEAFLKSRHSIRQFDADPVEKELIEKAVSLAITTPSICNRQMWKARVFREPDRKQAILALQGGNRGFSEQIDTIMIVTCDLQCCMSVGERNQAWIGGGMFSMTLALALHSLGLGACCLSWPAKKEQDRLLRKLIQLPEAEVVIMLIAVGHIPERLSVARSARKSLEKILFWE